MNQPTKLQPNSPLDPLKKLIGRNRHALAVARRLRHILKRSVPKAKEYYRGWQDRLALADATAMYTSSLAQVSTVRRGPDTKLAVVLHLYYPEAWALFSQKLKLLGSHHFDLFVTLPPNRANFAVKVQSDFTRAHVIIAPNRGRDVLPFTYIAPLLDLAGYEYILKLHSKKSPHRSDGSDWLSDMAGSLIPEDNSVLETLITTLEDKSTGVVGPQGQYVSLPVNFKENLHYISKIMTKIRSQRVTEHISRNRSDYGFFAGTMFWARLDALQPILEQGFTVKDFDPERGQIDATFAHALERIFCLIPELDNKIMYEVGSKGVVRIPYATDNIPDWSDVYLGPR